MPAKLNMFQGRISALDAPECLARLDKQYPRRMRMSLPTRLEYPTAATNAQKLGWTFPSYGHICRA